jgi:hypothetical protein
MVHAAMDERRHGVLDRRTSNWHDATRQMPPSPHDALALRSCVETIRVVLLEDDGMEMRPETLRRWIDCIALAVEEMDHTRRPPGTVNG